MEMTKQLTNSLHGGLMWKYKRGGGYRIPSTSCFVRQSQLYRITEITKSETLKICVENNSIKKNFQMSSYDLIAWYNNHSSISRMKLMNLKIKHLEFHSTE